MPQIIDIVKEIYSMYPVELNRNLSIYNIKNDTDYTLLDLGIFINDKWVIYGYNVFIKKENDVLCDLETAYVNYHKAKEWFLNNMERITINGDEYLLKNEIIFTINQDKVDIINGSFYTILRNKFRIKSAKRFVLDMVMYGKARNS